MLNNSYDTLTHTFQTNMHFCTVRNHAPRQEWKVNCYVVFFVIRCDLRFVLFLSLQIMIMWTNLVLLTCLVVDFAVCVRRGVFLRTIMIPLIEESGLILVLFSFSILRSVHSGIVTYAHHSLVIF